MTSKDPAHAHRAAQADPQDHGARFAATARRARADGPGVWLEALGSVEAWVTAAPEAQDAAAAEGARRLGNGWRLEGMRVWSCDTDCTFGDDGWCMGDGEVPDGYGGEMLCAGCGGSGRRRLTHRLALFTHLATGAEFSLVPGVMSRIEPRDHCVTYHPEPVRILAPFLVARWPVTHRQIGTMESHLHGRDLDEPVASVGHELVSRALAEWGLRLPSAAEWAHAARGGAPTRFPWGDEVDLGYVWCAENSWDNSWGIGGTPRPQAPAEHDAAGKHNAFGLVDTFGNVMEWCQDEANDDDVGAARVAMGGSYACSARSIERAAVDGHAARSSPRIGFRPVADVPGLEGL